MASGKKSCALPNVCLLLILTGSLNHIAVNFPIVFTLPEKRFVALEHLLRENCLFTVEQISRILQWCPTILLEDLKDVEYKFQVMYVALYFQKGGLLMSATIGRCCAVVAQSLTRGLASIAQIMLSMPM